AQRRQVTHLVRAGAQGHRPERGDRSEAGLAETELAGDQHRVEGEREDRADGDEDQGGVAEHHTSRTLRLPNSPCGRTTRIRNRSAKATRSRQLEPMYCTVNTSATPSSRPPTSAPGSEDIPPTMITARPLSSIAEPMPSCAVFTFRANRAPATAPSAEEIANVVAVTRSTFTPSTRAAVGFSAIARMPRPSRVRATRNPSATTSSTEITRIATCTREICATATVNVVSGSASAGNRWVSGPYVPCSRAMNTPASAIEEISAAKCASGRFFSGRKDRKSTRLNSSHVSTWYADSCLKEKGRAHDA